MIRLGPGTLRGVMRILDILARSLAAPTPEQSSATRDWAVLMVVLIVLGMIAVLVALLIVLRHRRYLRRKPLAREAEPIPDAWTEAGRRAEPADPDDFYESRTGPDEDSPDGGPPEESWR